MTEAISSSLGDALRFSDFRQSSGDSDFRQSFGDSPGTLGDADQVVYVSMGTAQRGKEFGVKVGVISHGEEDKQQRAS